MNKLVIATRGSKLALWQANHIKSQIEQRHTGVDIELLVIKTKGDIILDVPLAKVGGKGLFVKEIEEALLDGTADLAVHSMKDVPMLLPEGLCLGVITKREDPADLLLSFEHASFASLPQGATVGTSSLRRQSQLLALRPDLSIVPLRGNVDTRLAKLEAGQFDAIVMAAAGMARLGLRAPFMDKLPATEFLPAPGQGALGIEYKNDRTDLHEMLAFLDDSHTRPCVLAERAFLAGLDGGCQVPIAALARLQGAQLRMQGMVAAPDGTLTVRRSFSGHPQKAEELGHYLAGEIIRSGGRRLLEMCMTPSVDTSPGVSE